MFQLVMEQPKIQNDDVDLIAAMALVSVAKRDLEAALVYLGSSEDTRELTMRIVRIIRAIDEL